MRVSSWALTGLLAAAAASGQETASSPPEQPAEPGEAGQGGAGDGEGAPPAPALPPPPVAGSGVSLAESVLSLSPGIHHGRITFVGLGEYEDDIVPEPALIGGGDENRWRLSGGMGLSYARAYARSDLSVRALGSYGTDTGRDAEQFLRLNGQGAYRYLWPTAEATLTGTISRDDRPDDSRAISLRGQRSTFLRTTLEPAIEWGFDPLTTGSIAYLHTAVFNADPRFGKAYTHGLHATFSRQLAALRTGRVHYGARWESSAVAFPSVAQQLGFGLTQIIDPRHTITFDATGSITDRRSGAGGDVQQFGGRLTLNRKLTDAVGVELGGQALGYFPQGGRGRVYVNWIANLNGSLLSLLPSLPIPGLGGLSRRLGKNFGGFSISTDQAVVPTASDLENVGLVLRQSVLGSYVYTATDVFRLAASGGWVRTQFLEVYGARDAFPRDTTTQWNMGASASLRLSRKLLLATTYQRRVLREGAEGADGNSDRFQVSLSTGFGIL